ncbi:MAG: hypothetical protein KJ579_08520 [Verrucomicrobia bacterium]|nr:hypothetical protein [Verrucomicrobiota bacterium]
MAVNLKAYVRPAFEAQDALELRGAATTGLGMAEAHAFEAKIAETRRALDHAGVNDTDIRRDFRFYQGMIEGLKFRGDLIAEAKRTQEATEP